MLICVDADDNALVPMAKTLCHDGDGTLHRAFSLFVQSRCGRVCVQQRSPKKPLWPGFWANSCCSHPRWGESLGKAVVRRATEELGLTIPTPSHLFSFEYQARYLDVGSEHELCHVYLAKVDAAVCKPNPAEVAAVRWLTVGEIDLELSASLIPWTPWLRLEWPRVRDSLLEPL